MKLSSPEEVAAELVSGHLAPDIHYALFNPLEGLLAKFEAHFYCMVGPPRAYFEIAGDNAGPVTRVTYQTFKCAVQEDTFENRIRLADTMWDMIFKPLVEELQKKDPHRVPSDTLLFWRLRPYFAPLAGGVDYIENEPRVHTSAVGLRFRLAIPGIRIPGEFSGSY